MAFRGSGSYPPFSPPIPAAQVGKCLALWSKPCFKRKVTVLAKPVREGEVHCKDLRVIALSPPLLSLYPTLLVASIPPQLCRA